MWIEKGIEAAMNQFNADDGRRRRSNGVSE